MPTVLAVDDEVPVLELVARTVCEGGYRVVKARDGKEAWSFFQRPHESVDLVITDVVMPHMSGTELAARIAALNPDLPLILMSGFSPVDLYERGLSLSHGHLITKPFDPTALLSLVQQLLPK
jgi:two-component system cell cycle sensor histidine kinase/response regulator CckA